MEKRTAPTEYDALKQKYDRLLEDYEQLEQNYNLLRKSVFGQKSEKKEEADPSGNRRRPDSGRNRPSRRNGYLPEMRLGDGSDRKRVRTG